MTEKEIIYYHVFYAKFILYSWPSLLPYGIYDLNWINYSTSLMVSVIMYIYTSIVIQGYSIIT